jgi:hypothetical protein
MTIFQTPGLAILVLSIICGSIFRPVSSRTLDSAEPGTADSFMFEFVRRKLQYCYGGCYGYRGYNFPGWGIAVICVIAVIFLILVCCSYCMRRRALKRYREGTGPLPMFYRGNAYPPDQNVAQGYPVTQQNPDQQYPNQQYANQYGASNQYVGATNP